MKTDLMLQVQAWLDGELSQAEQARVAELVNADPAASALLNELKAAKSLLAANEPDFSLPESREFFWSKIQRQIESLEAPAHAQRPSVPWWVRLLAPAAGVAVVVIILASMSIGSGSHYAALHESDSDSEDVSTISFHSQTHAMTVVWIPSGNQ